MAKAKRATQSGRQAGKAAKAKREEDVKEGLGEGLVAPTGTLIGVGYVAQHYNGLREGLGDQALEVAAMGDDYAALSSDDQAQAVQDCAVAMLVEMANAAPSEQYEDKDAAIEAIMADVDDVAGDGMGEAALARAIAGHEEAFGDTADFLGQHTHAQAVSAVMWGAMQLLAEMATRLGAKSAVNEEESPEAAAARFAGQVDAMHKDAEKMRVTLDAQATEIIRLKASKGVNSVQGLHGRVDGLSH